jgi:hypothetical protein
MTDKERSVPSCRIRHDAGDRGVGAEIKQESVTLIQET